MYHCHENCNHNYCDEYCKTRHKTRCKGKKELCNKKCIEETHTFENLPCHEERRAEKCYGDKCEDKANHHKYIAIDPRTCKTCKAVFCYNCTLGVCFSQCCEKGDECPMSKNQCPKCNKRLRYESNKYEFKPLDRRQ